MKLDEKTKKQIEKIINNSESIILVTDYATLIQGNGKIILTLFGLLVSQLKGDIPEEMLQYAFDSGLMYKANKLLDKINKILEELKDE